MKSNNPIDEENDDVADLQECLLENWNFCFQYRSNMIKKANGNIDEILSEWPPLQNAYGFNFVSLIFFDKLYCVNYCNKIRSMRTSDECLETRART